MAEEPCAKADAIEELNFIRHKWKRMGRQFHIPEGDLESFQKEHDDVEQLAKVLDWLERNGKLHWKEICRVLETSSVGELKLASFIREKYCHDLAPGSWQYWMGIFAVLLVVGMPIFRGTCCPPNLESGDHIALQKIEEEAKNIETALLTMIIELRQALDESSANVDDIVTTLKGLRVHSHFELPKFLQERLPQEKLNVQTISKLFSILADVDPPLWDIHNYHLLEAIAKIHLRNGNCSFITKGVLHSYKNKLEEFENQTSFCLYSYFRKNIHFKPSTHSELVDIKLDRPCKNYSIRESEWTRTQFFNRLLGIAEYAVFSLKERDGSVHQWWIVPKSIIPLLKQEVSKIRSFCKKYGITAITINDCNILEHVKEMGFRTLLQDTKDTFVGGSLINPEFNVVLPVVIRMISLKLLPLPYFMYFSALTIIPFCSTFKNDSTLWKMPLVDTTEESALSNSLALCLMQWVAMVILSGYVCKWSLNQLRASVLIQTFNQRWFLILSISISVSSLGFNLFESITHDWGMLFYFFSAQTMNTVRTAVQATLLLHANTSFHAFSTITGSIWLLSIPILAQHFGMYGPNMWNLSTGTDIILQICLISRTRFRPLDFSSFVYVIPAYMLVFVPSQQFYFSNALQEGWSNDLHSSEKIVKCLAVVLFVELDLIILFSKLFSARHFYRFGWAKLSCNRWFIFLFALICTINSLLLTLVLWESVDDSIQQLFRDDSISRCTTAVFIKSVLTLTALTRLLRQFMEGLFFIMVKAGRKAGWCNSRKKLMNRSWFPFIVFLIQTFVITLTYMHQTNLNCFVTFLALIMDNCFRMTLSSWVFRNSYSSTRLKMCIRKYTRCDHSALCQMRSLLKSCAVAIIKVIVDVPIMCFRYIQQFVQFVHPPLQRDLQLQALVGEPDSEEPEEELELAEPEDEPESEEELEEPELDLEFQTHLALQPWPGFTPPVLFPAAIEEVCSDDNYNSCVCSQLAVPHEVIKYLCV